MKKPAKRTPQTKIDMFNAPAPLQKNQAKMPPPLHIFSDNSQLKLINVRELLTIPIWRGNRHLDVQHAKQIKQDIGDNISCLDNTIFRTIHYKENDTTQRWLIDGQHRQYVIRACFEEEPYFFPDFEVLVIEKEVEGEADAVEHFNILNNAKPQLENDPKLLANKYILALEKIFNTNRRNPLIRPEGKATKRPYLSSDILRTVIEQNVALLKQSNKYVNRFIEHVTDWNNRYLREYELNMIYVPTKDLNVIQSAIDKHFVLALDHKLPWVRECLMTTLLAS